MNYQATKFIRKAHKDINNIQKRIQKGTEIIIEIYCIIRVATEISRERTNCSSIRHLKKINTADSNLIPFIKVESGKQ